MNVKKLLQICEIVQILISIWSELFIIGKKSTLISYNLSQKYDEQRNY